MATYLLAWELGGGLGHLINLKPLAEGLAARGHRVVLALRDLSRAKEVFGATSLQLLQAPFKHRRSRAITPTLSFAHLLHNIGFGQADELSALAEAWKQLITLVNPDVIVFDHSPTALLAARGLRAKRVLLGTGFFCPLDTAPLTCLRPWLKPDLSTLAQGEQNVLNNANQQLVAWGEPALERIAQLFHPHDEHFLVTFPELDHYSVRPQATYWGAWPSGLGKSPQWPAGKGKKIFAYLKPFAALPRLLEALGKSGNPTIVYGDGLNDSALGRFAASNFRFETQPLDLVQVGRECDLAVLNANHGTAVSMLLAGKPSLQIPIYLEQGLLARALVRTGAALAAPSGDAEQVISRFQQALVDDRLPVAARCFAEKYSGYDVQRTIRLMLDRLEVLARGEPVSEAQLDANGLATLGGTPITTDPKIESALAPLAPLPFSDGRASRLPPSDLTKGDTQSPPAMQTDRQSAIAAYRRQVELDPSDFAAHYRLGLLYKADGALDAAIDALQSAVRAQPDSADAWNDLGCAQWSAKNYTDARISYEKALQLKPAWSTVHNNLGCVLRALGEHQAAIACYLRAIADDAKIPDFHNNLGCAYRAAGQSRAAEQAYRRALALRSNFTDALSNLGTLILDDDRFDEALAIHQRAVRIKPQDHNLHHNLGLAQLRSGRFADAITSLDEALRLKPDLPEMHFNRGVARLSLGQMPAGWDDLEWRLKSAGHNGPAIDCPVWDGSPLGDRTLLLYAEQGLGDTLQFIRYVPLLRQRGARVIVQVQPALLPILREAGIRGLAPLTVTPPPCDVHAPLMSLPRIFRTALTSIPANVPYLTANRQLVDRWRERLASFNVPRIGIHWQGSRSYEGDRWRSIPLKQFAPLAAMRDVKLVSLQKDDSAQIKAHANEVPLLDFGDELDGHAGAFMDTAAIIQNLDLVITSDSAVAHLAGALGASVWLCLPHVADWRWLAERSNNPWYPTMRLFRQAQFGDWDELFARVAGQLRQCLPALTQRRESIQRRLVARKPAASPTAPSDSNKPASAKDPQALYHLGLRKLRAQRLAEAIECFQAALELRPEFAEAHNDLGCALSTLGNHRKALEHFRKATELRPEFADAHNNLGCALRTFQQYKPAIASFQRALELKPDFLDAVNNLGNTMQDAGQIEEALVLHRRVLAERPQHVEAHNSIGAALQRLGHFDEALRSFEHTIQLKSDHTEAHYSRALIRLSQGDFEAGWRGYDARFQSKRYRNRGFKQPMWDGRSLDGPVLLIHAEQGLGDTLQFIRFVRLVRERVTNVVVEVQPALMPLLQQSGIEGLIARGKALPVFDYHVPLLSIPGLLKVGFGSIPAECPYLDAAPELVEKWSGVLADVEGLKVGINWQGSITYKEDHVRSVPLKYFEPLARVPGVQLVSLQKNQGSEQLATLEGCFSVLDLGPERDTTAGAFIDTAAIMKNLDLVLTSDTAVAHLAGALGVPTWLCLSHVADWRWLVDREDCPWYPAMRLFRQSKRGDWSSLFEGAAQVLAAHVARSANRPQLIGS